jgi:GGDEF domain-containing protein
VQPATPRRRPSRPVPEAPLDALAADAERLAKGWLVALIEQQPLSEAPVIASREWAERAPRVCAAAVRALGSDGELARLGSEALPDASSSATLRAVLWSALRSAWPGAEPDQVWDLGERLSVVIEVLSEAALNEAAPSEAAPAWPAALAPAVARARAEGEPLTIVLAELIDYDRMLAIESPEDCATVVSRFRDAFRGAVAGTGRALDDGESRGWVIARGAGRAQGEALAARIAEAVREAPPWRGAPLAAAVGIAVLGEDGADAGALIDAAEEAMFGSAAGASP